MASEVSSSAAQGQQPTTAFMAKVFSNPISIKLDEENFLTWKNQALFVIEAHKLNNHLLKEKVLERHATQEDHLHENALETYSNWENQDHHLATWLLASLDPAFCSRVVGCEFVHEIWSKIETYFALKTSSKVKQLRIQLKAMCKQGNSASEYLFKIKKLVDSLSAVGSLMTIEEHIEVISDGLREDYGPFITNVMLRVEPFTVDELEALLMSQEELLERFKKPEFSIVQAHLAQTSLHESRGDSRFGENARGGYGELLIVEAEVGSQRVEGPISPTMVEHSVNFVEEQAIQCGSVFTGLTLTSQTP